MKQLFSIKKLTNLILILLVSFLVSSCFAEEPKKARVIEVKPGEEFTIMLESNQTTGYSWQFAKPLDKSLLELIITGHSLDRPNLVGSPGKQMWTIKALKPGKTDIFFKYVRPWEKDVPAIKEETYSIIIKQ